jgi:TRAP-type C4-dicarboxylate transport system permease small subunit
MKEKLRNVLETIGYLLVMGFGFYILYFGFRMLWIFLETILK